MNIYKKKTTDLVRKYRLGFVINPGGGEFMNQEIGRCQVPFMDDKEDYEMLLKWLKSEELE